MVIDLSAVGLFSIFCCFTAKPVSKYCVSLGSCVVIGRGDDYDGPTVDSPVRR